tara:strand:+ start:73 stop:285 length:213 start_codon:yes stop_codon:yes gene_type:complete
MLEHGEWMFPMSVNVDDLIRVRFGPCRVTAIGETPEHTLFICVDVYDIEHVEERPDHLELEVIFMVEENV